MKNDIVALSDTATGNPKLAAEIADKRGYASRWGFSTRHVDNLLAQGLPHLAIGKRRVRIVIAEADAWMKERFGTRRRGRVKTAPSDPPMATPLVQLEAVERGAFQ